MYVAGIDLGGHTISAAVVEIGDGAPRIADRIDIATPVSRTLDDVTQCIADIIAGFAGSYKIGYAGIGLPGFLDRKRRMILKLTNFTKLENIEFPKLMGGVLKERGLTVDVYMENDANCCALGEGYCGAARGCSDFVVFTLGTGIGTGIVANGELVIGAHGMGGEAGHVSISDNPALCGCGGIGHLERAASADWIEKAAAGEGLGCDFSVLWKKRKEDRIAMILEPALDALARGIASAIVSTDPEVVVLNGGMSRAEGIASELTGRILPYLSAPLRPYLRVVVSELGSDAAIYGAASLCLSSTMSHRGH